MEDVAVKQAQPAELAQAQLVAYNARDMEAFLACYSDDVKMYAYPDTLIGEGKEAMRTRYSKRFADPALFAYVAERTVMGEIVFDRELVRAHLLQEGVESVGVFQVMAIYKVSEGKIREVRFAFGSQQPGAELPPEAQAPAF